MSNRDQGIKKGGAKNAASAIAALDALDTRTPRGKKTALGDGFVGTAGRETRGDAHAHEALGAQDNPRKNDHGAALTREDVIRLLRESNMENALPPAPSIPGFHVCYLSTTSKYDTIPQRERLGYTPVQHHEVRGFDGSKVHSAEYGDVVQVNEMILYKVPEDIYQAIMKYCHHDKPNEEASRITDSIAEIEEAVGRKNIKSAADDGDTAGFDALREDAAKEAPTFQ